MGGADKIASLGKCPLPLKTTKEKQKWKKNITLQRAT